ncbi:MAG: cyclase family protein [Chloroflexota bacterium]
MRIYDITLPISGALPVWPGDPVFEIVPVSSPAAGDEAAVSKLQMGSHSGTHLDAPSHLFPSAETVDRIPLESLVGDAWVSRLPMELSLVTGRSLEAAGIPEGTRRLLLSTANGGLWERSPWSFSEQYVALSPDAAEWVVARGIQMLGIDYLSVDPAGASGLPAHRTLLSRGVVVVEGLDLRRVPAGPYQLVCLPLRLEGADGAPVRVLLIADGP